MQNKKSLLTEKKQSQIKPPEGVPPIPLEILDDIQKEQMALGLGGRGYPAPGLPVNSNSSQRPKGLQSKKPRGLLPFEPRTIIQQAIAKAQANQANRPKRPKGPQSKKLRDLLPFEPGAIIQQAIAKAQANQANRPQRPEGDSQKAEVVSRPEREDGTDYLPLDPNERLPHWLRDPLAGKIDPLFKLEPDLYSLKDLKLVPDLDSDDLERFVKGGELQNPYVDLPINDPRDSNSRKMYRAVEDERDRKISDYRDTVIDDSEAYEAKRRAQEGRGSSLSDTEIKQIDTDLAAAAEKQRQKDYDEVIAGMPEWIQTQQKTGTSLSPQRLEQIYRKNNVAPYLPSGETDPLATPFVPKPVPAKLRPIGINDDGTVFPGPEEINRQAKAEGRQPVYTTTGKVSQDRFGGPADPNWRWDAVRHGGLKGAQAAIDNWNLENRVMVTKDEQRAIMPPTPEYIYVTHNGFQKKVLRGSELDPDVIQARADSSRDPERSRKAREELVLATQDHANWRNREIESGDGTTTTVGELYDKRKQAGDAAVRKAGMSSPVEPLPSQGATPEDRKERIASIREREAQHREARRNANQQFDNENPDYAEIVKAREASRREEQLAAWGKRMRGDDIELAKESIIYDIVNKDYFKAKNNIRKTLNENILTIVNKIMTTLSEEIVNPKNKGRMTKEDIRKRDRLADKVDAEPIKGNDKKINAKHRLATYIILKSKGKTD